MKDLTVYILTHNRGELLLETIESVLHQTCNDYKLIVSDNSTDDKTLKLLTDRNLLTLFEYRKRDCNLSSLDHLNLCIFEVNTSFFILFNDDDIMLPNYVESMYNSINGTSYIAVGCNAYKIYNTKKTKQKMINLKKDIIISNKKLLSTLYCKGRIVPFPSYIYSKTIMKQSYIVDRCGKYSDVDWLMTLVDISPLKWISKPLFYYRFHGNQGSFHVDYKNQIKLINLFRNSGVNNNVLRKYRTNLLYMKIREKCKNSPMNYNSIKYLFLKYNIICYIKLFVRRLIRRY